MPPLCLLILLLTLTPQLHSLPTPPEDPTTLDDLLSIDDELDSDPHSPHHASDASVLTRAQRILIELNNDNTKPVISQNEHVLLIGYTPWCPRSAEVMPEFAQAANLLSEWKSSSSLVLAKLDAERYPKAATALGIKGYPTLLLFTNGSSQAYTGGLTAEEIVIWARKKIGEPVVRLSSVEEGQGFVKKYSMFVVGLFDKFEGLQYEDFVKAAIRNNDIQFVETDSHEIAKLLFPEIKSTKPAVGLVKSEPEKYTTFDEMIEFEKLLQFLEYNKFPLVTTLTELNSVKVYSSQIKLQVYLFTESDEFKSLLAPLQEVAKKFKSKIMFIYADIKEDNLAKPFLTLLGLEESKKTVVAAFDNKISSKYLLEAEPTAAHIEDFCSGLLDGSVSTYYKSQAVPDNANASVLVVVGRTFDELVLHNPKNILLEVHTPWCMGCETTSKQVDKLAKHFKGFENVIFARIDASSNEHPKLQVTDYPALLFYPATDKSNPVKLSTKSSLKDLAAVIKKNVKVEGNVAKDEL